MRAKTVNEFEQGGDINFYNDERNEKQKESDEELGYIYDEELDESVLNPYDKIGVMMADEYGVDLGFDKTSDGLGVKQKDFNKIKSNKKKKDPFGTSKLGFKS